MSVLGVRGRFPLGPRRPAAGNGAMALAEHLRELRARLLTAAAVVAVGTGVAWFFYADLFQLLLGPYQRASAGLAEQGVASTAVLTGVANPLLLQVKVCALAAVVLGSPVWLYQIWAFILPGLHPEERRWTRVFAVVAGPLFLAGVAVGYYVLPKGIEVLVGFTPAGVENLVEFADYFRFLVRMLLVFGIAFEIPLFVVLLNLAGILPGKALATHRPWIVLGTFLFAAVATPSTDPFSMIALALPMTALFLLSEVVTRLLDRRRGRASPGPDLSALCDDEQSPLPGRC